MTIPTITVSKPASEDAFLPMLPRIQRHAEQAFRGRSPEAKEEAVQAAIADAFVAYARLVARDRDHLAHPSPLGRFGVVHVRSGRRVGTSMNRADVMSEVPSHSRPKVVRCHSEQTWQAVLAPQVGRRCNTPADQVAFRMDFQEWLRTIAPRDRQLIMLLARGERSGDVASELDISPGRVTQLRHALRHHWRCWRGEAAI